MGIKSASTIEISPFDKSTLSKSTPPRMQSQLCAAPLRSSPAARGATCPRLVLPACCRRACHVLCLCLSHVLCPCTVCLSHVLCLCLIGTATCFRCASLIARANVCVRVCMCVCVDVCSRAEDIEKAIMSSDLNLTPSNDGNLIRINIPPLTTESRVQYAKQASALAEDGKVGHPAPAAPVLHASLSCGAIMRLSAAGMLCLVQVHRDRVEGETKGGGKDGGSLLVAPCSLLVACCSLAIHACATRASRCLSARVSEWWA